MVMRYTMGGLSKVMGLKMKIGSDYLQKIHIDNGREFEADE